MERCGFLVWFVSDGEVLFFESGLSVMESVGLTCPATFNRADFYASQLAVVPGKEVESHRKIQWLCDEFDSSRYGQELVKLVTQARNERRSIIPCRKEFDDHDLQSLLEKCYISNPEVTDKEITDTQPYGRFAGPLESGLRDIDSNVIHSDMILNSLIIGFLCDVAVKPTPDTS
uniref:Uncharacterized protein n=1 Tax=Timema tahoe TaxID=61484 RepID=A0A7R9ISM0_9NEOP|nr:unnamed protein product [Timema tahoe]